MSRAEKLFTGWVGMAPDVARDDMAKDQVWLMRDWIPNDLGSRLESRSPWVYSTNGPLNGPPQAQRFISTQGLNHHLAVTEATVYNLDSPNAPRVAASLGSGGGQPLASLWEFVCVPRRGGQLPVFLKYTTGSGTETVLTTHATTPRAGHAEAWNNYFVLGNTDADPSRLFFLGPDFADVSGTTSAWDSKAWVDTNNDITAIGRTRAALIIFHANGIERLRGSIPPGQNRQDDLWRETLSEDVGCPYPHTISYWNDNLLFCDARGAYMTDGTQIKPLTQGINSRAWQTRATTTMRLAAGIFNDYWVISAIDTTTWGAIDCWVCHLPTRRWFQFTNVGCWSLMASGRERLYGGTSDGKIVDLSRMWDESDPATDNVDGNGVAVRPLLETAFYPLTNGSMQRRRIKNVLIDYLLNEASGAVNLYACEQPQPDANNPYILLKTFRTADQDALLPVRDAHGVTRRRAPLGREAFGVSFKIEATGTLRSLKLFDLGVEAPQPREDSYV